MAKIKQTKMRLELDPAKPGKETVVNICYDSTDRNTEQYSRPIPEERFYIKLPQIVTDALGYEKVTANDQAEVMVRFEKAIKKFKCLESEVNRIIVYEFSVDPSPGEKDASWRTGYKVYIMFGTYDETVMTAGDGNKRYFYEWVESNVASGGEQGCHTRSDGKRISKQVPFNDKNASFFLWIKKNMLCLIKSLYELEQPDKLIETIHAGRLLPLGDQKREN